MSLVVKIGLAGLIFLLLVLSVWAAMKWFARMAGDQREKENLEYYQEEVYGDIANINEFNRARQMRARREIRSGGGDSDSIASRMPKLPDDSG